CRRKCAADCRREQNSDAPCKPQQRQSRERNAAHRQASGPVRNRRQQEPADDGGSIAVQHFMNVPIERAEIGRQRQGTVVLRKPEQNAERRPRSSNKEKRPKSVSEQRGAGIIAAALQSGRNRHEFNPSDLIFASRHQREFACLPSYPPTPRTSGSTRQRWYAIAAGIRLSAP